MVVLIVAPCPVKTVLSHAYSVIDDVMDTFDVKCV